MAQRAKTVKELQGRRTPADQYRPSSNARGYDRAWSKFRRQYLELNPFCLDCAECGAVRLAQEVHHIKKVRDRPDLRLSADNVMGLCKSCHSKRTAKGE